MKEQITDYLHVRDEKAMMTLSLNYQEEQTQQLKRLVEEFGEKLKKIGVDFRIS